MTAMVRELLSGIGSLGWDEHMTRTTPHRLETLELTLKLMDERGLWDPSLTARGYSSTKRTALWVYQEAFDADLDAEKGYTLRDAVDHIVLVCQQDKPNTKERLNFALSGGLSWDEPELF